MIRKTDENGTNLIFAVFVCHIFSLFSLLKSDTTQHSSLFKLIYKFHPPNSSFQLDTPPILLRSFSYFHVLMKHYSFWCGCILCCNQPWNRSLHFSTGEYGLAWLALLIGKYRLWDFDFQFHLDNYDMVEVNANCLL